VKKRVDAGEKVVFVDTRSSTGDAVQGRRSRPELQDRRLGQGHRQGHVHRHLLHLTQRGDERRCGAQASAARFHERVCPPRRPQRLANCRASHGSPQAGTAVTPGPAGVTAGPSLTPPERGGWPSIARPA
jgi:hypothetical protein